MAQKKAIIDHRYKQCSEEAINTVKHWYRDNHLSIDANDIYIVWFAFTKVGYKCMVTSNTYKNLFFEISKNMYNDEMLCLVLQQVECIASPKHTDIFNDLIE